MSFATGIQLGPALYSGSQFNAAPFSTPQTPFFGNGGVFKRNSETSPSINATVGTYSRNGIINSQGAKAVYIQPLMRELIESTVTASGVSADSDVTGTATRIGFEVYGMKTIGDPQTPNEDDNVILWNIGFIQSFSWVDSTFAIPASGTDIVHPDDGKIYRPYVTGGVADVSVVTVAKTRPHYVVPTMSSSNTVLPDATDGTDTAYTDTADSSFCIMPLNPSFDHVVLSLCSSNESGPKIQGVFGSYRFALIY